jgi:hypothetical protein
VCPKEGRRKRENGMETGYNQVIPVAAAVIEKPATALNYGRRIRSTVLTNPDDDDGGIEKVKRFTKVLCAR